MTWHSSILAFSSIWANTFLFSPLYWFELAFVTCNYDPWLITVSEVGHTLIIRLLDKKATKHLYSMYKFRNFLMLVESQKGGKAYLNRLQSVNVEYYQLMISQKYIQTFLGRVPTSHLKSDCTIYTIHGKNKLIAMCIICVKGTRITLLSHIFPRRMLIHFYCTWFTIW